jgi:ankyrin repeat protein
MSKARIIAAVRRLDVTSTEDLLEHDPTLLDVADRRGFNLLHLACSTSPASLKMPASASVRIANVLLDRGLELESPVGRDACTALFFAVQRARNPLLVKALVSRGAKPANAPGGALFAAAWWGDRDILKILLDAGATIDIVVGVTPFLGSWCWRRFEGAKALAEFGADVNYQDPKNGKTALHYGIEKEFALAELTWLVRHGASLDLEDHDGVTARSRASRKRDKNWLRALE